MPALQETSTDQGTPWYWIALAVALAGWVLSIVFVARVLAQGGAPASTLLWVLVILLAPWVGIGLYYLFPRRLQLRRVRAIRRSQARLQAWRAAGGDRALAAPDPDLDRAADRSPLHRLLASHAEELTLGNRVRWLPAGSDFFAAAAEAIARAERYVHFEVYIFRPDATGRRLLDLLTAAARRGVAVRLLYDSFGSLGLKAFHLRPLHEAGGTAVAFLPLLWKRRPFTVNLRNHRKVLVVDGRSAFVGGRNVGDEYATDRILLGRHRSWYDAMVQVDGPAAAALHGLFVEDWYHATDQELPLEEVAAATRFPADDCVGVVGSGPDRDSQSLLSAVVQAINGAERQIALSSPYLMPPPVLLFALSLAAARGVRVRLFTNGPEAEAVILYSAQRSYYQALLDAGIELWETTSDYNHAKVLVVDERIVVVGSANMDMRSTHLNFEVAVVLPDSAELAAEVQQCLDGWYRSGRRIEPAHLSASMLRRVLDGICRLLSPLL